MPGANVSVRNIDTGIRSSTTSDGVGNYTVGQLPPGKYEVSIEMAGFKKFVRPNITLELTRQLRIDVQLETGSATETVNVEAETPLVETETGQLSSTISTRELTALPSLGRNLQDFRLLVPGVALNRNNNAVIQGRTRPEGPVLH